MHAQLIVDVLHAAQALDEFLDLILRAAILHGAGEFHGLPRDIHSDVARIDRRIVRESFAYELFQSFIGALIALRAATAM